MQINLVRSLLPSGKPMALVVDASPNPPPQALRNKVYTKASARLPPELTQDAELQAAIDYALPPNYDFEIHKTIFRIRQDSASHVALQFPEGLLMFADQIAAILQQFAFATPDELQVTILGDVTYGACCIDDLTCEALEVDLLVHYGHSCLVPVTDLRVKSLYVFVRIAFDFQNLIDAVVTNFAPLKSLEAETDENGATKQETRSARRTFYVMGTIQYSGVVHSIKQQLQKMYSPEDSLVVVPQERPLTAGEVLGCTSPTIEKIEAHEQICLFIADGRFHLESLMIANPHLSFYRFDPFQKILFREGYDHEALHRNRRAAVAALQDSKDVGLILGTLGRQGSVGVFDRLEKLLRSAGKKTRLILMSELVPERLCRMDFDVYVQVACPRLSIDWGHCTGDKPLLTPYEAFAALDPAHPYSSVYPMDFYSKAGGPWSNYYNNDRAGFTKALLSKQDGDAMTAEDRRARLRAKAQRRHLTVEVCDTKDG